MNNIVTVIDNEKISSLLDIFQNPTNIESDYLYDGYVVPRVTKIIGSCIHSDSLMYWVNSLGFKRQSYSKTINMAADIGTQCHNAIDDFLDNNYNTEYIPLCINRSESSFAYNSFLKWWNDININNIVNVLFHEKPLVCKYFGGTMDGLYEINGKKYLIDYKTSNHITYRYFLQLAAYRYMLREQYGILIDGCIILQLSKNDISYNEQVLNFDNIQHLQYINDCETAFLSMVYSYYNIFKIEKDYKKINWG